MAEGRAYTENERAGNRARAKKANETNASTLAKDPSKFTGGVETIGADEDPPPVMESTAGKSLPEVARIGVEHRKKYAEWSGKRGSRLKSAIMPSSK